MIYYVIHSGTGEDGGFGDYSNPTWTEDPLSVYGKTIWFASEEEARQATDELNKLSQEAFYSTGTHVQYDGQFPLEYEYRKITVPDSGPVSYETGVKVIKEMDEKFWKDPDGYDASYEIDEYIEDLTHAMPDSWQEMAQTIHGYLSLWDSDYDLLDIKEKYGEMRYDFAFSENFKGNREDMFNLVKTMTQSLTQNSQ